GLADRYLATAPFRFLGGNALGGCEVHQRSRLFVTREVFELAFLVEDHNQAWGLAWDNLDMAPDDLLQLRQLEIGSVGRGGLAAGAIGVENGGHVKILATGL